MFLYIYTIVSIIFAGIDIFLALSSFHKKSRNGLYLGLTCLFAATVVISYLFSILHRERFFVSLWSSVYFLSIDWTLVSLLVLTFSLTRGKIRQKDTRHIMAAGAFAVFDSVVLMINPISEIALHYVRRDSPFALYKYDILPLYCFHLAFTYLLVVTVVVLLIRKTFKVPREYKACYYPTVIAIFAIVLVNGFFLFVPDLGTVNLLDYSVCGYSVGAFCLYWSCFHYSTNVLVNRMKMDVIDHVDQGILLFDYQDEMILRNQKTDKLLPHVSFYVGMRLREFCKICSLEELLTHPEEHFSIQHFERNNEHLIPMRCDYRVLRNAQNALIGKLLVFSDMTQEIDLLTGFQSWNSFCEFVENNPKDYVFDLTTVVFDINSLSTINQVYGTNYGDHMISELALLIRETFPKGTFFVRGTEAHLFALCYEIEDEQLSDILAYILEKFDGKIQYGISKGHVTTDHLIGLLNEAESSMRAKKLLDKDSMHSDVLTSLIRALQEYDSDTEHHIRRTQKLGEMLGRRIELSDADQSRLALLCILHDIGKVGVPLDILNKQGKLTDAEWTVLKTHTDKGYEIAMSSQDLKEIAPMIRFHHERWDGKGYPIGLSRESIPLLSRIISIVDSYDAMTNDRTYRKALSVSQAVGELRNGAGTQFDPFLVSEFIRMLEEEELIDLSADTSNIEEAATASSKESLFTKAFDPSKSRVHSVKFSRYIVDENMRIISVDPEFENLTGYSEKDVMRKELTQTDLIPEEDRAQYICIVTEQMAKSQTAYCEHRLLRKDGTEIFVFCFGKGFFNAATKSTCSEIIVTNISDSISAKVFITTEQQRAAAQLKNWEDTFRKDPLTGLLTHSAFQNDLEMELLKDTYHVLFIMMDVDRFKQYNDTRGHRAGDEFLIYVAQALSIQTRDRDLVCRMGGDEFAAALLFPKEAQKEQIAVRTAEIFEGISMLVKTSCEDSGISMGATLSDSDKNTFNALYEAADKALYQAKENGRGQLVTDY